MRKRGFAVGFALVLMVASCGIYTFGQSLCDFEMPESTIGMANLSFSYRHFNDGRTEAVEASGGWLAARMERLHDSPGFGYTMWASTQLGLEHWLATSWLASGAMSAGQKGRSPHQREVNGNPFFPS